MLIPPVSAGFLPWDHCYPSNNPPLSLLNTQYVEAPFGAPTTTNALKNIGLALVYYIPHDLCLSGTHAARRPSLLCPHHPLSAPSPKSPLSVTSVIVPIKVIARLIYFSGAGQEIQCFRFLIHPDIPPNRQYVVCQPDRPINTGCFKITLSADWSVGISTYSSIALSRLILSHLAFAAGTCYPCATQISISHSYTQYVLYD